MRTTFDTNVALYLVLDDDSQKRLIAQKLLQELSSSGDCFISTQVLKEFAGVATRKLKPPMREDELLGHLADLRVFERADVTEALILLAVRRHYTSRINYFDALLVETALAGGAEVLYSEDLHHGMKFDSMTIVNPFL